MKTSASFFGNIFGCDGAEVNRTGLLATCLLAADPYNFADFGGTGTEAAFIF